MMGWHQSGPIPSLVSVLVQGFTTPDGRRQQLCGTRTEAREAEAGQAPEGQTISTNYCGERQNEWKVLGNQLNAGHHSRGLAQRVSH